MLGVAAFSMLTASCAASAMIEVAPGREPPTTTTVTLPALPELQGLTAVPIATGLSEPVSIAPAAGVDDSFIVERTGRILTLSSAGTEPVLDLTSAIAWEVNEQGLLGFAVHPSFPDDPRGFAVFTDRSKDLVVASFTWADGRFDESTRTTVLEVPQPHKYHQGGGIAFGPAGYLWMSFGDGGGIGDSYGNGQDPTTLNGSIVRIDVDHGQPYALPPDNPFIDSDDGAGEVWAYGLRNPWRFAIDGDWIVIADVGQYAAEEINVVPISEGGHNFGWPILEADECFDADTCDATGTTPPELIVPHERTCAIIGGPVYRGKVIPELHGHYLYGDFCVGWIRSAPLTDGSLGQVTDWESELDDLGQITSIDADHTGELVVSTIGGDVYRIVPDRAGV